MANSSNRPTALFISPHLDYVAFSCGGTLALLAGSGWRTVLATVFTRSVPDPAGFALACHTEKGISPGIDYMALRREEDRVAARILGVENLLWLDLPEAPHRGYVGAPALFSGVREGDEVWQDVLEKLTRVLKDYAPELVFAPQALGAHVDHLQVVRAVRALKGATEIFGYRDAPRTPCATRRRGPRRCCPRALRRPWRTSPGPWRQRAPRLRRLHFAARLSVRGRSLHAPRPRGLRGLRGPPPLLPIEGRRGSALLERLLRRFCGVS